MLINQWHIFTCKIMELPNAGQPVYASLFFFFLLHTASLLASAKSSVTPLRNGTDHLSLLAFKLGINGDPNGVLSSWNDSLHFCKWAGVTCSKKHPQRVSALNLTAQSLEGILSPHVANLSFLKTIDLSNNNFHGQIPQEVGRLFRLQYLDLNTNSFSGGIPQEMGALVSLLLLNLGHNSFESSIPQNLSQCLKLKGLALHDNKLVGKIPVELSFLSNLRYLSLDKNNLIGGIPASLGNLSSLAYLYLMENNLEGVIPSELRRLEMLNLLALGENKLSGMIPSSIYNLSSLIALSVAGNYLDGSLPPELGLTLPNLESLYLGGNLLTGPLPRSLGNASGLLLLDFGWNNFTGSVPDNFGSLMSLTKLNIGGNQLGSGKGDLFNFITSLTNCSNLKFLDFNSNQFSGPLPFTIANLSSQLSLLWLDTNQLSGTIPSGIENLSSLSLLSMFKNHITGSIPAHLGKLQKLETLYLNENRFSGPIPFSLGNLTRLYRLYLDDNNLHGAIPLSLGNCQRLQALWLSYNNLEGSIPKTLFNLPSLSILVLENNALTGPLPWEIKMLENLEELRVSENKLSGEIPSTLGSCIKLESLKMRGNFFHGSIPSSLSALKGLEALDLSSNNFSGKIPKFLEQLHALKYLNLSFNNFDGEVPKHQVFENASGISVTGNSKLCGGISELHLPTCPKPSSKRQNEGLVLGLIISGVFVILLCLSVLLSFLAIRRCLRKSKRKPTASSMGDLFIEVSYANLVKATDGFSSTNLIGVGSFGTVYKGAIDGIETTVAIKVLKLQQSRASKSFTAECKSLRSIQHRNIVKILTVCSSIDFTGNDFKALVFEYLPNGSLDMWLHPNASDQDSHLRNLNIIQRINIAIDVACALEYLHQHCHEPVVHCDLKPSNVLLDKDMVAHVGDFGLARILSEDVGSCSHTQSSSLLIKGSIGYVAPEYGTGSSVSTHGDVYSYGILLLEMFTGKRPTDLIFEKDNLSLRQFVKMALPDRVMDVVDHRMLSEAIETNRNAESNNMNVSRIQDCLLSLVKLGISCSAESPKQRMEMKDVVKRLHAVRDLYLGVGKYQVNQNEVPMLVEAGPSYLSNY